MPKIKKIEEEKKEEETSTPAPEKVPEKNTATVFSVNGGVIRVYTREIHGDIFEECAQSMSAQHPGSRVEVI